MTHPSRVLVMDDDPALRSVIVRSLREEGYDTTAAASGAELLEQIDSQMPDALILDIGLPDCDGRDVCRTVRARDRQVPILMLTARGELVDRLSGFDAGADDYLTKPFALQELLARLEALLRRASHGEAPAPAVGGLVLDPSTFHASEDGVSVRLTPTEFRLLARLVGADGAVVTRTELKYAGWPRTAIVNENTLDAYIARIRKHLREFPGGTRIETVPNAGYRIEC